MPTFISVHDVKTLVAKTVQGDGCVPHLTLNWEGERFEIRGEITLYIDDAILNERLIRAINSVIKERRFELETKEMVVSSEMMNDSSSMPF